MGSTISPILVNYVLDDLIIESLQETDFRVPFVKRYVDDLLLALPTDKIDILLNKFNSYDVNLQFTLEKEVDNSIPFLDMRIIHSEDNILRTTWYRKPMSSDRSHPKGGGVGIWAHESLSVRKLELSDYFIEQHFEICGALWRICPSEFGKSIVVGIRYTPTHLHRSSDELMNDPTKLLISGMSKILIN
nr:unnamed protein product [Callosobruchus analis]